MNIFKKIKYAIQRVIFGFDERAIFDTDEYLAHIIPKILYNQISYDKTGGEELNKVDILKLDIAYGFNCYLEMRTGEFTKKSKEFKQLEKNYKKGLKLFIENFEDLWIM